MSANFFYVYFYFSTSSQFTRKVQQHPKFSIDVINQAKPEQQKPSQANAFYVFVVYFSFSENKKAILTLLVDIGTYIFMKLILYKHKNSNKIIMQCLTAWLTT